MPVSKANLEESYSRYDEEEVKTPLGQELPIRKIVTILLILVAIIIILILAYNLLSQTNNPLLFFSDGKIFKQTVTVSKDAQMIDSFTSDGNALELKGNPLDSIRGTISSSVLKGEKKGGKITITGPGGRITILNSGEGFFIDANGNLIFTVSPADLVDLEQYYDENTGEYIFPPGFVYETTFEFVITDEETGEEIIIIAPINFVFENQNANSCIVLNRSFINESTHYGSLPTAVKLSVICEASSDLTSSVSWKGERMGNVEVILGNYNSVSVLTDYNKTLISLPAQDEYPFTIIFTPFKDFVGQKAFFTVNFMLNRVDSKIEFEVPIDNLEQCIQITPEDLFLGKNSDSVSFKVDVSSCYSEKINVTLCENDEGCAGGTEGGINLSEYSFILSPKGNSSKLVTITKEEMAGAYGIPIYARVTGASKVLVDEKIVIVEPFKGETVYPERFVLSMIGTGKDSIQIRNNDLAEDVEVNSSVCNLFKSSTGAKLGESTSISSPLTVFGQPWWIALAYDRERYAGIGKYQAAFFSSIGKLEKERAKVQNESYIKNSQIKQSYLMSEDVSKKIDIATVGTDDMIKSLSAVKDKMAAANEFGELEVVSQVTGLATGAVTMYTNITFFSTNVDTALTATTAMAAVPCVATVGPSQAVLTSVTTASGLSKSALAISLAAMGIFSGLVGSFSTIDSFTKDIETINAASALNNTKKALEKLDAAKKEVQITMDFAKLTLVSASINSFYSISSEDFSAKNSLNDVTTHMNNVLDLLTQSQTSLTNAMDDITIALPEMPSNTENIIQIASMLASLVAMMPGLESDVAGALSALDAALVGIPPLLTLAATECTATLGVDQACCTAFPIAAGNATAAISSTNLTGMSSLASITETISLLNTVYSLVRAYQQMSNDYSTDYQKAASDISALIPKLNDAKLAAQATVDFLPTSVDAANWLGVESKKTSDIANYTSEEYGINDETYNKKRMNGIVGTILGNAFVNGAYLGGVYSLQNNFNPSSGSLAEVQTDDGKTKASFSETKSWKENCENTVTLTLPDYKINLLQDAQRPILSTQDIVAFWDFSNPKVYDVFEEQTVDMSFSNSGLRKNIYGVLELPLTKHTHKSPTEVTGEFGPFNVPDETQAISYKYHMKFNTVPRKSNNYTSAVGESACGSGILRGQSGSAKSLPRVILSWDWNSVNFSDPLVENNSNYTRKLNSAIVGTNNKEEPYLDASQLSILLSKKLGSLEYYLETAQASCPANPIDDILIEVAPNITTTQPAQNTYTEEEEETVVQRCYLPLSTREYDGKPALYYYLPKSNTVSNVDSFDNKTDIEKINGRDQFLPFVDFNVFLMRDGYGVDFQSDFVASFSSKAFSSAYSFLNNSTGIKNYFYNSDRFFFSSKANNMEPKREWALPDAGKYRVRALIDFEDNAQLFVGGSLNAKIIIMLELLEPVSSDYSPLYYTPIDGFTGLTANNNRIGYGSSLTGGYNFDIVNTQGAVLSTEQKNSLNKIKFVKSSDFFLLNSLPSMRSKILDYSLSPILDDSSSMVYTPTTATPLLFEIKETSGQRTILDYSIVKEGTQLSSKSSSLFILSKLNGCYDYTGKEESSFINNGPDYGNGRVFGLYLPIATETGSNFVKTVAYSPIQSNYFIKRPLSGAIYSPLSGNETNNDVILSGVTGMTSNYSGGNETVDSLEKIMQGIQAGSICVASLGTREIFFWPEEQMFNEKYIGKDFANKQANAMDSCLK